MTRRLGTVALAVALWVNPAAAQVIEPNGEAVPKLTSPFSEPTYLDAFFIQRGEPFDPVATAVIEPGAFWPACSGSTTITLLLRGSAAQAGLSWYNVPADQTAAPAEVYELLPESAIVDATVTIDFATDQRWTGAAVGFVLIKTGVRVYYSEYRRNVLCSQCTAPDHWKMMLPYASAVHASAYYLAFEDWEGANESDWQSNDGDFNDQVFFAQGLSSTSCAGGSGGTGGSGGGGTGGSAGNAAGGSTAAGGSATGGDSSGSGGDGGPEGGAPPGAGGSAAPDSPGRILGRGTEAARTDPLISSNNDGACACRSSSGTSQSGSAAFWAAVCALWLGRRRRGR